MFCSLLHRLAGVASFLQRRRFPCRNGRCARSPVTGAMWHDLGQQATRTSRGPGRAADFRWKVCACVCACVRFGMLLQRAGCRFEVPNLVSHSRQGQEAQFACKAQTLLLRVSCLTILFSRRSDLQCCGSLFMGEREWERGRTRLFPFSSSNSSTACSLCTGSSRLTCSQKLPALQTLSPCSDIFSISDGYPFLFLVTRDD